MTEPAYRIHWGAVVVALVLTQLIPMAWYTAFGEPWMALTGITEEKAMSGGSAPYIFSTLAGVVQAFALAYLFAKMRVSSALQGFGAGALIGFAFCMLETGMVNMFEFRPAELSWIDGGQPVATYALAGLVLGGWRKRDTTPATKTKKSVAEMA